MEHETLYATYRCPICGAEIERDACLFLTHAKEHIFEALRRAHPEWAMPGGSFEAYRHYYENQFPSAHSYA